MAIPDGDGMLIAAANFGRSQNPAWYANVRAHPDVVLTVDGVATPMRVTELHGDDRDRAFARALRLNPGWLRFRARAGERGIPVLRLRATAR
jgi:deazaflavin-dependent oxidoreductase (nitroreductase family)